MAAGPWAVPARTTLPMSWPVRWRPRRPGSCLQWIDGPRSKEVPIAAARLLAARQPAARGATAGFLPRADDQAVVDAVKAALANIAARPGKTDPALLAALNDPLPLRRAVAVEVLSGSGHAELLPAVRKSLADPKPQVRLRAALALTQRNDDKAVEVLIDLLADLPADDRRLAEQSTAAALAGEWSPALGLQGDDSLARKVRREAWAGWWRTMDGPALLTVLRQRMLSKNPEAEKFPSALPRLLAVRKPAAPRKHCWPIFPKPKSARSRRSAKH